MAFPFSSDAARAAVFREIFARELPDLEFFFSSDEIDPHVGRGPQLDQAALIEALDSGRLAAAMLDVTDREPLPQDHPLWSHPKVMITPHIASVTQPDTAAQSVVENIRRHRAGEELIGAVDRTLGY
jgi:glyoxylate/hydroxypyruvate reductase A